MVIVLGNNEYSLVELPEETLLVLGKKQYRWIRTADGSEKLTRIKPIKPLPRPVRRGNYWLFDVVHTPKFTHGVHLSMVISPGEWAAYLLHPGLPTKIGASCSIEATDERIANPRSHASTND